MLARGARRGEDAGIAHDLDLATTFVRAADGTRLAVVDTGSGPPFVLANGLGGSIRAWHHLIAHFSPRFRMISWDYRGLYDSAPPTNLEALTIEDHRDDLCAVMDALGIESAVLAGWSMGVQVILDFALRHPGRVRALIPINGSPGDTFRTAFGSELSRWLIPFLATLIEYNARALRTAFRWFTSLDLAPDVLKRVGLVAPNIDADLLRALAGDLGGLDLALYMRTMRKIGSHSTWPRLHEIDAPTLVVGGTRDRMTPAEVARATAAAIPGAELLLLEGGTHYTPLEFPEAINQRIDRFLAERLDCASPSSRIPHSRR